MAEPTKMLYKRLGNSSLQVSRIAFGNWLNSDKQEDKDRMVRLVKQAWDLGINFFDTAEAYGGGEAEKQFAVALKALNVPRHSYVLSTKIYWGPNRKNDINDQGLSRKHIIDGLRQCLERLEHSYVDVVFAHRFDPSSNLEEVCRAFDWVVKQGWAHYWGTSEWTASEVFEAFMICEKYNLTKPIADQCQYNIIERQKIELDYGRLFDEYGYGTTVWSPLAGGLLTGRYNDGIPEDSRLSLCDYHPFIKKDKDELPKTVEKFKKLGEIAKKLDVTQAQLAMAWVLKSNDVSTAITGASRESQLVDIVGSLNVLEKLTPKILQEIEDVFQTRPEQPLDWRKWAPKPNRR